MKEVGIVIKMMYKKSIVGVVYLLLFLGLPAGCSDNEKPEETPQKQTKSQIEAKADGQGIYDGLYCGLSDREGFKFSKGILGEKKLTYDLSHVEEITDALSIELLKERSSIDFNSKQMAEKKLGKPYVDSYIIAFKEGYNDAILANDEEALGFKKLLEKAKEY